MGSAGYRFVEINTYLAKVTKVTAASTDRNGHVTDATVDRKVYQVNDTGIDKAGVEAEGCHPDGPAEELELCIRHHRCHHYSG